MTVNNVLLLITLHKKIHKFAEAVRFQHNTRLEPFTQGGSGEYFIAAEAVSAAWFF